ncbi:MAG: CDP-alcohol phosphatidyltransferase family protein [Actinomycetota bacterium]
MIAELWNVPNVISLVRLALIPVFIWLVAIAEYGWAGVLLAVIGSTDWIDGYLARRLGQVTEVGKFLDPLADRLAVIVAVIAGLISSVLPAPFAIALIIREILIGIGAMYGWSKGVSKLDVRWLGKAATLLLYVSIAFFYIGVGFDVDIVVIAAWITGIPGLIMYYWVAVEYLSDMKKAIAHAR